MIISSQQKLQAAEQAIRESNYSKTIHQVAGQYISKYS